MIDGKHSIVVAGDVTVDWFMYPIKASDKSENLRLHIHHMPTHSRVVRHC